MVAFTCGVCVDGAAGVGWVSSVGVDDFVLVGRATRDSPSAPSAASLRDLWTRGCRVWWEGVMGGVVGMRVVVVAVGEVDVVLIDVDVGDVVDVV